MIGSMQHPDWRVISGGTLDDVCVLDGEAEDCTQARQVCVGHLVCEGDIRIGIGYNRGWRCVTLGVCHVDQVGGHMDVDVEGRV